MIKHDIQNDFDIVVVKRFNEFTKFSTLAVEFNGGCIACVWRKKADGIVSPVFQKTFSVYFADIHALIKFEDRHELNSVDSELLEIGNLFFQSCISAFVLDTGGGVACKAPYMQLIDDELTHFPRGLSGIAPVKYIFYDSRMVMLWLFNAPDILTGDSSCVWIEQDCIFIKKKSPGGIVWTIDAIGVFKFTDVQTVNNHGIDVSDFIGFRKREDGVRFFFAAMKQQQFAGSAAVCMNGKINAAGKRQSAIYVEHAGTDRKTGNFAHRTEGDRIVRRIFVIVQFQKSLLSDRPGRDCREVGNRMKVKTNIRNICE